MRLFAPERLDDDGAASLLSEIRVHKDSLEEIEFDFSRLVFAEPFGALVISQAIRRLTAWRTRQGLDTSLMANGIDVGSIPKACSYLGHVGFFTSMGWITGKLPGEASGSPNYLPITVIKSFELGRQLDSKSLAKAVRVRSLQLTKLIVGEEDTFGLVLYCLSEVIRNVFEHSGKNRCVVMAQKYHSGREVEIAILDQGKGIPATMAEAYSGLTVEAALLKALKPGTSRTRALGVDGNEVNAGFGLYVLSRLARESGVLSIWSSNRQLNVGQAGRSIIARPALAGTGLRIRVKTEDAEYFTNRLAEIVKDGEAHLTDDGVRTKGPSRRLSGWDQG